MAVGLALAEVFDHGQAHGLRGAVAEQAGIADVERDDLVTLALQFVGPVGQLAANFVADALQNGVGFDVFSVHVRLPVHRSQHTQTIDSSNSHD